MAKYGQYNWSPDQMERINARREKRGQEKLVNTKYGYEGEDSDENQVSPVMKKSQPESTSALDQYKAQKGLRERMAERVSLKDEMEEKNRSRQVNRSVESEIDKMKRKQNRGISTPSIKSSFNRMVA
jgi:hypothetical protein